MRSICFLAAVLTINVCCGPMARIAYGAPEQHWAFVPPERPALPTISRDDWPKNAIDQFVLARLDREGLKPSPAADPTTLIRRLTLDLTGLPPTQQEVDAFLEDKSADAFADLVDRLLESPRYGERLAMIWLDAARYADTSGYQTDGPRYMWRWRDWVIEALQQNMPFDQFTIEQLAGDMLPAATLDQRIASGFNRNHRGNAEGGVIPEEYQVEYVVDRVDTTSTVWLGLTIGCARCHDHKFDPVSQLEFYRMFAYFNNVPEYGRAIKDGNSQPYIAAPTRQQQAELQKLESELAQAEEEFQKLSEELRRSQSDWESSVRAGEDVDWTITRGLVARYEFEGDLADATGNASGADSTGAAASFVTGRVGQALECDGDSTVDAGNVAEFGFFDKFSLGAWIYPRAASGTIISRMIPVPQEKGYYLELEDGHVQANLIARWLDDSVRVETSRPLALNQWHHVMMTYDGSRTAAGVKLFIDGHQEELVVHHDFLNQTFAQSKEPLRIGAGQRDFIGLIDDVRIYDRDLAVDEVQAVATADSISTLLAISPQARDVGGQNKLRGCFLSQHAPERLRTAHNRLVSLREQHRSTVESLPTVMVMEEMETPRETFVLIRGQYDKHGERVTPGVPAVFPALPAGAPNNRLGLAHWLVDPANPLTARVTVNRFWRMFFGTGLVKTEEDFGVQGERPSHPELLDWMAAEFVDKGWDIQHILRLIVSSATYQQDSALRGLESIDPENRLLARGPRLRLPAEMIRDQALAASGLLVERVGGPSVSPYQPDDLWAELTLSVAYEQSHGDDLYRRSMYTFWKRTVAPPTMVTFDATARESCTLRRSRTNTPLQALALMNDVTFVEASRALAQRVMLAHERAEERIEMAFRLATARRPRADEARILAAGLDYHLGQFRQDPAAAEKLVTAGEHIRDETLDVSELAAYTTMASLILNLDETITKE